MEKIYKNNKFLFGKIFNYNKLLFFIRLGYSIITSLSSLIAILLPKYLLEAMLSNELIRVIEVLSVYFAISILISLLTTLYYNYDRISSEKMYVNIINEFLNKGISLDLSFFDKSESYSKFNRAFGNCCNTIESCNNTILSVITSIIQILMIGSVLIWVNIYVFLAVLFFVLINITINNVLKKIDYDFNVALSEKNKQVNYFYRLFYTPQFFRDIKANVIDKFIFDKKQIINNEIIDLSKSQIKKTTKFKIILSFLSIVEYVLAAFYFAYSVFIKLIAVTDYFTGLNAYLQIKNSINKGDKLAILGKNGAGKTTIIKLLLRLYDPDEGSILINGKNIKDYNTHSLRSSIRTLFQDFAVYAFSIYDNITLGKKISDEKIDNALKEVDLFDKISHLKNGINTPITSQLYEGGVELSGGETQKIAISRIFSSDCSFFILDEPTSSLDPYAEYNLYNKLLECSGQDNTFIVISHRLTLTHKMSKIIVVENGSIVECGNHAELMERGGIYAEMYKIQSEKYSGGSN